MKAIIPMAGKGTRLRPHTYITPKPLMKVAGRPVMSYVLDDLVGLGVDEMVLVVGYLQGEVREYMAQNYPDMEVHYVVQEVQDGTAGAVQLAEPYVDDEVIILFVDTLFEADLGAMEAMQEGAAGVIWAKEVEDYQRYGVIVTDDSGAMKTIVEKPSEPISRLANIGFYYIKDHELLFEGIRHVMNTEPGPSGEFYLTDAFQYMVDQGARLETGAVDGWYDCGKPETLLETNEFLLRKNRATIDDSATVEECEIVEPVRIEAGVVARGCTLGPNVTLEAGAEVTDATIAHSMIGAGATIVGSSLHNSIVGPAARVSGVKGRVSVMAHAEVVGD